MNPDIKKPEENFSVQKHDTSERVDWKFLELDSITELGNCENTNKNIDDEEDISVEDEDEHSVLSSFSINKDNERILTTTSEQLQMIERKKLLSTDIEEDIDSEEKKGFMKKILEEINKHVRQEMKEELQEYENKLVALREDENDAKATDLQSGLDNVEPRLQEAIIKMRKLDRILERKIKKEKEVKRQRLLFQKRLHEEMANIKPEGQEECEVNNTKKFLALTLPSCHDEGIELDYTSVSPIFQTQLQVKGSDGISENEFRPPTTGATFSSMDLETDSEKAELPNTKKTNFIKRNIQLASDADSLVAMTAEEKERLDNLLCDLDDLPEEDIMQEHQVFSVNNQLMNQPGNGFTPDIDHMRSLLHIDSQLKSLLSPDEFQSISSTPTISQEEQKLFTKVHQLSVPHEFEHFGEKALLDAKEDREQKLRLQKIEKELQQLSISVQSESRTPGLSESDLRGLLESCACSLSRSSQLTDENISVESSPRLSTNSLLVELLKNPPHLDNEVLQKLLSEAQEASYNNRTISQRLQTSWTDGEKEYIFQNADCIQNKNLSETETKSVSTGDAEKMKKGFLPEIHHNPNLVAQNYNSNANNCQQIDFCADAKRPVANNNDNNTDRTLQESRCELVGLTVDFEKQDSSSAQRSDSLNFEIKQCFSHSH